MANIDPDLIPMFEAIEKRLAALEESPVSDAEAKASIEFNSLLFAKLSAANDRAAVWQSLSDFLRG